MTHPSGNGGNLSDPDSIHPYSPVTVLGKQVLSVGIYTNINNSFPQSGNNIIDSFPQSGPQIKEPLACGCIVFEGHRH